MVKGPKGGPQVRRTPPVGQGSETVEKKEGNISLADNEKKSKDFLAF